MGPEMGAVLFSFEVRRRRSVSNGPKVAESGVLFHTSIRLRGLPRLRGFMKLFLSNLFESQPRDLAPSCIQLVKNTDALCGLLAVGGRDSSRSIK